MWLLVFGVYEQHAAWCLATHPDPKVRKPARAVELAKEAIGLKPFATYWNTLGAARYRAGDFQGAVEALQ